MTVSTRGAAAWLSILLFWFAVGCRRGEEPSRAARETEPAAAMASAPAVEEEDVFSRPGTRAGAHPIIWLGLDGLDWEILDRLAAQGRMPNWKRLAAEGYQAKLRSFFPLISPVVWTTAATGVGPEKHRVLDFQEVDPKTGEKVPISGRSRAVPAVWNVASAAGRRVGVVGWWATHPAEQVEGFFVSDRASPILFEGVSLDGATYPVALASGVREIAAREGKVSDAEIARFVDAPLEEIARARKGGAGMEVPVVALSRILAATRVNHRIARDLYDRDRPDLTLLYLEGTDEIGHVFASYAPPRLSCVSDADAAAYGHAAFDYYALVDRVLGQWMRRAEEDHATLLVHSDHGFKWGDDRPCRLASAASSTAAFWHRLDGVFAAWGARVRGSGGRREAASVFDVPPTVLALLGLAPGPEMTRRRIDAAFVDLASSPLRAPPSPIAVRRVEDRPVSREQASDYAKKLLALGYLSGSDAQALVPPGGERPGMTEAAWNNLGVYERDTRGDPRAARRAFEASLGLRPDYYSAMFNLAVLDRSEGRYASAADWLFRSLSALRADPAPAVVAWSREYERAGRATEARSLLERAVRLYPSNEELARALGMVLFRAHACRDASSVLSAFEAKTADPKTLNDLALFQTCLGNRQEVVRLLERSLELDPAQPEVERSLKVARASRS